MLQAFAPFLVSTALALLLVPAVRELAVLRGLVDRPDPLTKVHTIAVPRLGGVAVAIATFAALATTRVVGGTVLPPAREVLGIVLGGTLIALLGFYDDLRGANAPKKLVVQLGAALLCYQLGFRIDRLGNPFGQAIELSVFSMPVTFLWIVAITNAFNLIDGVDGLAAGSGIIGFAALAFIGALKGDALAPAVGLAAGGALLGFLAYNLPPASIFLGDTGSMFVGFMLALVSITAGRGPGDAIFLHLPAIALVLPIADTVAALARRWRRRAPLFDGDRGHLHHELLGRGLCQRQVMLVLWAASVLFGLGAVWLAVSPSGISAVCALLLLVPPSCWVLLNAFRPATDHRRP